MWNSFKVGLKMGFDCFLASYTCIFFFFLIGCINFLNLYIREFSFLDLLSLIMCVYNTYWISGVIHIRKSFQKITLLVLVNESEIKLSQKKFIADLIFSIFWKEVYSENIKDEDKLDTFIQTIVIKSIDSYNQGTL